MTQEAFVRERLAWSESKALRFVQVFELFQKRQFDAFAGLTIDASSLYLIAAPSSPEEVTYLEPGGAPPNPIVIFIFFGQRQPEAY